MLSRQDYRFLVSSVCKRRNHPFAVPSKDPQKRATINSSIELSTPVSNRQLLCRILNHIRQHRNPRFLTSQSTRHMTKTTPSFRATLLSATNACKVESGHSLRSRCGPKPHYIAPSCITLSKPIESLECRASARSKNTHAVNKGTRGRVGLVLSARRQSKPCPISSSRHIRPFRPAPPPHRVSRGSLSF